jgi:hypothetical protein
VEELEDDGENLIANVGSVAEKPERPSIFAFVGRENTEAGEHLKRRIAKSKGKGRPLLKSKRKVHESIARNSTAEKRDPNEYLIDVEESGEQVVMLDRRDFKLPAAPADLKLSCPMRGQGTRSVSQWDFSTGQEMSVTAKNPHERYVGRNVRKAFRIRRKVRQCYDGVAILRRRSTYLRRKVGRF